MHAETRTAGPGLDAERDVASRPTHTMTSNSRKRGPEGTRQSQLWRLLKANGPMTATAAGEALGCSREQARRAMKYLQRRNFVAIDKSVTRAHVYSALGVHVPTDRRGKPAGSRNMRGRKAYANMLRNFRTKCPERIQRPAGTELERLWK